jgi:hypothetical protein
LKILFQIGAPYLSQMVFEALDQVSPPGDSSLHPWSCRCIDGRGITPDPAAASQATETPATRLAGHAQTAACSEGRGLARPASACCRESKTCRAGSEKLCPTYFEGPGVDGKMHHRFRRRPIRHDETHC